jgi:hypothetical protein
MAMCRLLTVNAVELSVAVLFDRLLPVCGRRAIAQSNAEMAPVSRGLVSRIDW